MKAEERRSWTNEMFEYNPICGETDIEKNLRRHGVEMIIHRFIVDRWRRHQYRMTPLGILRERKVICRGARYWNRPRRILNAGSAGMINIRR